MKILVKQQNEKISLNNIKNQLIINYLFKKAF